MVETFENGSVEICKDESVLCWINTEALPVEIIRLGIFRYVKTENKYNFSELCKVLYRHPQAPDMSVVPLLDWIDVDVPCGTETTLAYAIDGVKGIQSVAKLSLPECYSDIKQRKQ